MDLKKSKREELFEFFKVSCDRMQETVKAKNSDYSGTGTDPFKNFRRRGAVGFLVRMDDKMARLDSFIEKGSYAVKDESVLDTCLDLAAYALLLAAYLKEEKDVIE